MALTPPVVTDWVVDSDASKHTTSDVGNLTFIRPPTFTDPSSILNNVLVTPDIIQNLLSVHHFTTDNWCFM
jgi:hypothetical protein